MEQNHPTLWSKTIQLYGAKPSNSMEQNHPTLWSKTIQLYGAEPSNSMEQNHPTLWSRTLLEKLIIPKSKNFPHFTKPEVSLPRLQQPATWPYPEPG
jgi:hypothetical protein